MLSEQDTDRYREIARRIDTGLGDDRTDRALTVFHIGPHDAEPVSGWVTFPVSMPWRIGKPLPPIEVRHLLSGSEQAVQITKPQFTPAENSDASQRGVLEFDLRWEAFPVLPGGWDTYIAAYGAGANQPPTSAPSAIPQANASDYVVVEALRSPGDLPPRMPDDAIA